MSCWPTPLVVAAMAPLTKIGNGVLTLGSTTNSQTFKGNIMIQGNGTSNLSGISIAADSDLGAVPANAIPNSITLANNGTLTLSSTMTISGNRGIQLGNGLSTVGNTGEIIIPVGTTLTYPGIVADAPGAKGILDISGGGTYVVTNNQLFTNSGGTIFDGTAAPLTITGNGDAALSLPFGGAGLDFKGNVTLWIGPNFGWSGAGTGTASFTVDTGSNVSVNAGSSSTTSFTIGTLKGNGTLNLFMNNAGSTQLGGILNQFNGTINWGGAVGSSTNVGSTLSRYDDGDAQAGTTGNAAQGFTNGPTINLLPGLNLGTAPSGEVESMGSLNGGSATEISGGGGTLVIGAAGKTSTFAGAILGTNTKVVVANGSQTHYERAGHSQQRQWHALISAEYHDDQRRVQQLHGHHDH